jgi:RNA polymerase sigma factor (sigma-70 family)
MANTQARIVLQHIREMVATEQTAQLRDQQLVERFAQAREEAAFDALVKRHGPLVLGVCRRVLHNWHDAEDAFQATFLILARKAGSIGQRESVASWLYRVAFHTALKAKASAASRQRREQQTRNRTPADPLEEVTGRELLLVLDEELQHLPECLRTPLVLCYLQGKTRDEAAQQLGWSLATLKRRLEKGRQRLRLRLEHRGLALSAALLGAGLAQGIASATVPAILTRATVKAALNAAAGKAATLAEGVLQAMFTTKLKIATAVLLVIGVAVLSASTLTHQALAQRQPEVTAQAKVQPGEATQPQTQPVTPEQQQPEGKKEITIAGQVLSPDGKAVAGAQVVVLALFHRPFRGLRGFGQYEELGHAQTDREGRFHLTRPRSFPASLVDVEALAAAPGYGLGWCRLKRDTDQADAQIRLHPEQVIHGQFIDLQGQPAARVKFFVAQVSPKEAKPFSEVLYIAPRDAPVRSRVWPEAMTADDQGQFHLRGLGKNMTITLVTTDERFARQRLAIHTDAKGNPEKAQFVLLPPHHLEGKVVAEDTGQPLAKVLLHVEGGESSFETYWRPPAYWQPLQGWTDEQGRFRLHCPPGNVSVCAYTEEGSPYLSVVKYATWPKGTIRQEIEIKLPRGIRVRGKVVESPSGKPVAGAVVDYFPVRRVNPFARDDVLSWYVGGSESVRTAPDGTFQATILPGPGHIAFKGSLYDYALQTLDTAKMWTGRPGGAPLYTHDVVELDLKPETKTHEVNATLRRAVTLQGQVLGPDGKPVSQALLLCSFHLRDQNSRSGYEYDYYREPILVKDGRFTLPGCDPKATFPVYFVDFKNQWGATVKLSGEQAGKPITVRLERCGSAKVRLVDQEGKPVAKRGISVLLWLEPAITFRETYYGIDGSHRLELVSDEQGRLTLPALIPGAKYMVASWIARQEFTVKAGETLELPDIKVEPQPPKGPIRVGGN